MRSTRWKGTEFRPALVSRQMRNHAKTRDTQKAEGDEAALRRDLARWGRETGDDLSGARCGTPREMDEGHVAHQPNPRLLSIRAINATVCL